MKPGVWAVGSLSGAPVPVGSWEFEEPILNGAPQSVDGRFSLRSTVLLFADENGEDAPIDVTRIAIFDRALTAVDAVELGSPYAGDPALVEFLTPPYLQNVKVDGMTIMWECDLAAVASVDYGLDTAFGGSGSRGER